MPGLARSSAPAQTTPAPETSAPAVAGESQEARREQLAAQEDASGLANYQSALGQWLGGELYGLLSKELAFEKLQKHATSAWEGALGSLVKTADGVDGNSDELGEFSKALKEQYGQAAADLLETDTGHAVVSKLTGWVDAHPRTILMVALLAAGGAIAANVKLPELKQKLKLGGGFSANVEADLGKIRELALKQIKAELEYSSGPLVAAISATRGEDGTMGYGASATLGNADKNLKLDAKFTEDGLDVFGLHGLYKTDSGTTLQADATQATGKDPVVDVSLTTQDGDITTIRGAKYDANSGTLSIRERQSTQLWEGGTLHREVGGSSDGSSYGEVGVDGKIGDQWKVDGTFRQTQGADGGTTDALKGGVHYTGDRLAAGGTLEQSFGATDSTKLGLYGRYNGDNGLKLAGDYQFDTNNSRHTAKGMAQTDLGGGYKGRVEGKLDLSSLGTSGEVGAYGYKDLGNGVGVFGGGAYRQDEMGGRFVPKAGVDIKGVPVEYSYDPATKAHKVGVTLFRW